MKTRIIVLVALVIISGCKTIEKPIAVNENVSVADIEQDLGDGQEVKGKNVLEYNIAIAEGRRSTKQNPAETVQEQLNKALSDFNVRKGVVTYKYYPEMIYVVMTSEGRITDIELEPNEKVYTNPVIGDHIGWEIGSGKSGSVEGDIEHVYIKPEKAGMQTNMIVNTNKRVYRFLLKSNRYTYMPNIVFQYPEQIKLEKEMEEQIASHVKIDLSQINFGYSVTYTGRKSRIPFWIPERVFDDGAKTFIYIPEMTRISSLPVVFAGNEKDAEIVNTRVRGLYVIMDGVFDELVLTEDIKKKGVVRVQRRAIR